VSIKADTTVLRRRLQRRLRAANKIVIAEICDYEARRELLRRSATAQIARLDQFIAVNTFQPIDTQSMRTVSELWAKLRNTGLPTAAEDALDGDVILAAQALQHPDHQVATTNLKHLQCLCRTIHASQL
jgi:predicted nucleic acid-binding protein